MNEPTPRDSGWGFLFAAWLIATVSTLGSLFFSEVMELPPCSLCWYQRIFMFPLPVVLFMGLMPTDSQGFDAVLKTLNKDKRACRINNAGRSLLAAVKLTELSGKGLSSRGVVAFEQSTFLFIF